jgi:hypothetical protein
MLVVSITLLGCRPEQIPAPATIQIPSSLNHRSVEIAILSALAVRPPPAVFNPRETMNEDDYEKLVWNYYLTAPPTLGWAVESRKPGVIIGLIRRTDYHLRVAVQYDDQFAKVSIVDSSGLDQTADSIHGKAVGWILKLETRIRTELQQIASI